MTPLEELVEVALELPSLVACSLAETADAVNASDAAVELAVRIEEAELDVLELAGVPKAA